MKPWAQTAEALMREHGSALFGYAYVLTGDRAGAEDLVQDALVRTFSRGRKASEIVQARAYVKRAIFTTFVDGRRRAATRPQTRDVDAEVATADHVGSVAMQMSIHAAVLTLPPRERACVVLRYLEDLPVAAVAEELALAEGTVKRYLSDAVAKLRMTHPDLGLDADDALSGGKQTVAVVSKGGKR